MAALVEVCLAAGHEILERYGSPGAVTEKEDRSPLTDADRAAHDLLVRELPTVAPGVPVLSEESPESEGAGRRSWERFWLVDPLDGTKEFLRRTGEFTVNVALVERGRPVVGVVHVPALGRTYRASPGRGAEVAEEAGGRGLAAFRPIRTRPFRAEAPVLVASRDHAGPGVQALARALGPAVQFTSMGSSLKFCLVAEGKADLYLRDLPTMEWDTAAAQCVLEHAGGAVFDATPSDLDAGTYTPLRYNKDTLRNPPFLAAGDPRGSWRERLGSGRGGRGGAMTKRAR
jgi:3'(2'), 5'-bisphosphate nucleotidase